MQELKIIDDAYIETKEGFVLKLDDISEIADSLDLSLEEIIKKIYYYLQKCDFVKARAYYRLYIKMNGEKCIAYKLLNLINGKDIINIFNNEKKNIVSIENISRLIINFYNTISKQSELIIDDELKNIINSVEEVKTCISNELKVIISNIENYSNISINEIECLENIIDIYNIEIDLDKINKLKRNLNLQISKKELIDKQFLIQILNKKYDNSFFESDELNLFIQRNKNIRYENYNDLLKDINESYLIYRYNLEIKECLSSELIFNLGLDEYFNLPMIYRDFVLKKLKYNKRVYQNINELRNDFYKIIGEIKSYNIKAIPV